MAEGPTGTTTSKLEEAKEFLRERVLRPPLISSSVDKKVKNTVAGSLQWIEHFKRIGDLVQYIDRFTGGADTAVYNGLKAAGLETFEDIRPEFVEKFSAWQSDLTRLDDFVVGETYSSFDLSIFSRVYDNRSGGILPIGNVGNHRAVFIKATLVGGKYANAWLEQGSRLKYYLKSITVKGQVRFDEGYKPNRAIIDYPSLPIYTFVRQSSSGLFCLAGLFRFNGVHAELDGSKWFDLVKVPASASDVLIGEAKLLADLQEDIKRSQASPSETRKRRLAQAPTHPPQVTVIAKTFVRNPDVIAEVLDRAAGHCEACGNQAPFVRTADSTPYLEVHHKIPLAAGGEDTVENAVALCPNCHRQEHFGPAVWPVSP